MQQPHISPYAQDAFYAMVADEKGCRCHMCAYLAELLGQCCGHDVEFGLCCANEYAAFLKDTYGTLQRLSASFRHEDNNAPQPQFDEASVAHAVFAAQLKVVFPCIEEFRLNFVKKYAKQIRESGILDSASGEEPMDVELGSYYFHRHKLPIDDSVKEKLSVYREYRNKLAHLETLPLKDVEHILQSKGFV